MDVTVLLLLLLNDELMNKQLDIRPDRSDLSLDQTILTQYSKI